MHKSSRVPTAQQAADAQDILDQGHVKAQWQRDGLLAIIAGHAAGIAPTGAAVSAAAEAYRTHQRAFWQVPTH